MSTWMEDFFTRQMLDSDTSEQCPHGEFYDPCTSEYAADVCDECAAIAFSENLLDN